MDQSFEQELLDTEPLSDLEITSAYRELQLLHNWLGNTRAILRLLRAASTNGRPIQRVLDIGCAQGDLLAIIHSKLGVEVVGIDLRPALKPAHPGTPVLIYAGNAVVDPLPHADIAVSVVVAHHLSESELTQLIVNVSRSCQRLILLDLVRHPVPLVLFRLFVWPFLCRVNRQDGQTSIRRAYTKLEMRSIIDKALSESGRPVHRLRHTVAPLWIRQVVDISWEPAPNEQGHLQSRWPCFRSLSELT